MRARSSVPGGRAKATSVSSTSYGAEMSNVTLIAVRSPGRMWPGGSVLGQAEPALADAVALDLARAPRDCVLSRAHHAVVPAHAVGHVLARLVQQHAGAEELAREVRDAHAELGAEELQDGALRPRGLAAELPGQVAVARVPERGGVDG